LVSYADSGAPGGYAAFEKMHGMGGPASHSGIMTRRYIHQYGDCSGALAQIGVSNRDNAVLNPIAVFRKPLTEADYFASKLIAEPLRLFANDGVP
jgi:acetyl-CoA acetyltransferase